MKLLVSIRYILLLILFAGFQTSQAQTAHAEKSEAPEKADSVAILKAKYDSLVAHINNLYITNTSAIIAQTEVQTNEHINLETHQFVIDTPPVKTHIDTIKSDTMLLDNLSSEDLLVDTLSGDGDGDLIDGDHADEEGIAEGEFDNLFTGYSDVTYWDMLRDPNFKFDPNMIPAHDHYPFDWDTIVINPYQVSLKEMNDTILIKLKDSMDCFFHPPAIGDITSTFGFRKWGRKPKFHYGVDVRMEVGDPVYAIFDGVVRIAKRSADYGYVVLIRHYNGLETLYAHFDQLLAYPGKPVRSGEIIGLSGNTGRSTGPHLHFEVRFKGEKIDPNKIISFPTGSLLSDSLQIDKSCFSHLYKAQQAKLKTNYYIVKKGDTLGKIAYKNGVTVKQIAKLNRIPNTAKLRIGQKLRIR
jgi:murein DD-endopeptidase MepM/ murein hydrolase activator NlpD